MKKQILNFKILLCASFCISAFNSWAQMTLQECLLYAREHAHANIASRLKVKKAGADIQLQASLLMPKINSNMSGSMSFGRNIDPATNTYDTRKTLSTSVGVGLGIPLFDGLVSVNSLKALKISKQMQIYWAQIEEDRISIDVIKAFCNVSYCKAMSEQMKFQVDRDSLILAFTLKAFSLGTKSKADVAEMEAVTANSEYELINQQNLLRKAQLTLMTAMGMSPDEAPFDIVMEEWNEGSVSLSENPKVSYARLAVKEGKAELRAARGGWLPTLSFSAGINTSFYRLMGQPMPSPDFGKQLRDNLGEYLSLSMTIPIFDGFAAASRVKRASVQVKLLENELSQTIHETLTELKEAELSLCGSIEESKAAQRRFDAESAAYHAITRKYELGASSPTELYTSGAKLASARAALEGKRLQSFIDKVMLDYYNGIPLIRTQKERRNGHRN